MSAGDLRVLILVPPFAGLDRPAIGPHVLQACARRAGFELRIEYANISFAERIGEATYHRICYGPTTGLAGERVFAQLAHGLPRLGRMNSQDEAYFRRRPAEKQAGVGVQELDRVAEAAKDWVDGMVDRVLSYDPDVVGASTTFEQTNSSLALLAGVKSRRPDVITLLGGGNCEGEMAEGLLTVSRAFDYVFSGECEGALTTFLETVAAGARPPGRVVRGSPCTDMDDLPRPNFHDYYDALGALRASPFVASGDIWLPYECSRGCWWGQKSHCTFCGVNGESIAFRQKSASRVLEDLQALVEHHPSKRVCMVDNIMPHSYYRSLLPDLAAKKLGLHVFFEQKANLRLWQVELLRRAGVAIIQPGIEALSTELLASMRKGVTASQNIRLLRYCRSVDLSVNWNLLYALPGDVLRWYEDVRRLIPDVTHLHPPSGVFHLSLDRFSPYLRNPTDFGIRTVSPMEAYGDVLPPGADVARVAYHFTGDYDSESRVASEVMDGLREDVLEWRRRWSEGPLPTLSVTEIGDAVYLLLDTRAAGRFRVEFLGEARARIALAGTRSADDPELAWAVGARVLAACDGGWVPLATGDGELLRLMEEMPGCRDRPAADRRKETEP